MLRVKNYKDYCYFDYTPYLDRKDKSMDKPPEGCPYGLGDVVVIIKEKSLGVVLGCISEVGDLRTDADGMQCWSTKGYLRPATMKDFKNPLLRRNDMLDKEFNHA